MKKLHEVLCNFYSSLNTIRAIKSGWISGAGHVALMGDMGNSQEILIGRPEGKRLLGVHRHFMGG
jgi:hypothetical protein